MLHIGTKTAGKQRSIVKARERERERVRDFCADTGTDRDAVNNLYLVGTFILIKMCVWRSKRLQPDQSQ